MTRTRAQSERKRRFRNLESCLLMTVCFCKKKQYGTGHYPPETLETTSEKKIISDNNKMSVGAKGLLQKGLMKGVK